MAGLRPAGWAVVVAAGLAGGCGLVSGDRAGKLPPSPLDVVDRDDPADSLNPLDADELKRAADSIRLARRPATPPDRTYDILVLSGGGTYGAFSAGALVGWTEAGSRPKFDVVTGISTGALIAAVSFAGPENDPLLRQLYTTVTNDDIFRLRRPLRAVFSPSVADATPYESRLRATITPALLARVAAEHAAGRRLYVGTTNLPNKRLVVWDLGAIAAEGDNPLAEKLFEDVLLASSAVPGFFPPVRIPVDVDGKLYTELHVDGGVTRSMFFRAPWVPPSRREGFGVQSLYGSNLWVLVAGKIYADPAPVRPRSLAVAGAAISSLLYSQGRGDLDRLFHYSVLTGMNFRVAAIPPEYKSSAESLSFDPVEMTRLFEDGRRRIRAGVAWADRPPVLDRGEDVRSRAGLRLTRVADAAPAQPVDPTASPVPPPAVPGLPIPTAPPVAR